MFYTLQVTISKCLLFHYCKCCWKDLFNSEPRRQKRIYDRRSSNFLKGQKEKWIIERNASFKISNGNGVKFWYHGWFNSTPLHLSHQKASKPAVDKHAKVADLVHQGRWKLSLKRQPNVEEAQELV